jgi:hypothetical protein
MNRWDRFWDKAGQICTVLVALALVGIIAIACYNVYYNVFK